MDVEKTIEFLLENQARFQIELDQLRELTGQIARQQLTHTDQFAGFRQEMSAILLALAQAQKDAAARTAAFEQETRAWEQRHRERMDGIDERLNALIQIVDGVIRRDSDGKTKS